ncbi:MAG: hypothetical protein ACTSQA_09090 [Candidatus Heimdallarchaeaceae archaeon]
MKISKSIILPEWESIEDLSQASDILHKITEAMKDHQIENYEDAVASFRRLTTGRIQSRDGETYFDLDSGVIKGEIVFRPGSSGLDNIEEAKPNDWDNAFRLANAVKGDDDFTLISGSKIVTGSIAVGAFNSDVVARMFSSGASQEAIEGWMKSGAITYIDGNKIYAGSITLSGAGGAANDFDYESLGGTKPPANADHTADVVGAMAYENVVEYAKLGTTIIEGGYIKTSLLNVDYSIIVGTKPPANADYFGGSAGALAYLDVVEKAKLGTTVISGGYLRTDLIKVKKIYVGADSDEDIYFEDSAISLYDYKAIKRGVAFKYGAETFLSIQYGATSVLLKAHDILQISLASGKIFNFYTTGYHNRLSQWRSYDSSAGW